MVHEREDNSKKKYVVILLCLLLAIGIVIGSLFAFFSDVVTGNQDLTAGTLALVDDASFFINGSATPATAEQLACINPGDTVKVEIDIENVGSKSAWLKSALVLSGVNGAGGAITPTQLSSVFTVYEGTNTSGTPLTGTNGTNNITFADAGNKVIDGTYEKETTPVPGVTLLGRTDTTYVFTIVFSSAADNFWQSASIGIGYEVSALQYRNNPTPNWSSAVANAYKVTYGIVTP